MQDKLPSALRDGKPMPDRSRWTAAELFGTLRKIVIKHGGQDYRLRIAASGELILTK